MPETRVVIMGAAGRDFHNFLTRYRDDENVRVVAFTATQIPGIDDRIFPPDLAGPRYPDGIPIRPESELVSIIRGNDVDQVVFAYSDVSHAHVMHAAERVIATDADFVLLGAATTMVRSNKPVISVCAVRTGVGKSGISKRVIARLRECGMRAVDIRHPMPYRDLSRMAVERYASLEDLDRFGCTIEEREEYEHLIADGIVVYAGVDYAAILAEAEKEADVIVWDGGNNDLPFIKPDTEIVALDPHRAGHERAYHPGEANFLRAHVLVITKTDSAPEGSVAKLRAEAGVHNHGAIIVETVSTVEAEDPGALAGKRVLVIEDGPTVTHGGMDFGAGALAARAAGATLVDPRPAAVGSIAETFAAYPHLTEVLPAMGYSATQLAELTETVRGADADVVVIATPIDLGRLIELDKPAVRVSYRVDDGASAVSLDDVVDAFCSQHGLGTPA